MAGKKGKGNNTAGRSKVKVEGEMLKLMNLSETQYFCEQTGKLLPRNGMVVRHDGKLFCNREALRQYLSQDEAQAA